MARKFKPDDKVDTNGWMNTYADTVTLLLCFFILLFSYSTVNESKWEAIVRSFRYPFYQDQKPEDIDWDDITWPPVTVTEPEETTAEPGGGDTDEEPSKTDEDLLYEKIKEYVYHHDLSANIEATRVDGEIRIRFTDVVLFDPDSYLLRDDGKRILAGLCKILNESIELISMIEIQGHTAANVKGAPEFTNTFEFSTYRALNVLRYAIDYEGIDPYKISAKGYGQYHPVGDNETEEGRKKNRRVEIVVISTDAARVASNFEKDINTDTSS
ncbi:MAG: flagellar motor protein MotB [Clostridiales bacterium]|nr:flagellar motor protein MotB [Clostridiales bacterium]